MLSAFIGGNRLFCQCHGFLNGTTTHDYVFYPIAQTNHKVKISKTRPEKSAIF
jgi:hypothetical protein